MLFSKALICRRLAAAGLLIMPLSIGPEASAAEDTNTFNSVLGFIGLQFDKEAEGIDYRARAPLVLPPKMDLPKPVAKEGRRSAEWPTDPDVAERRRKAADSHQPAPQVTWNSRPELSQQELARGRSDAAPTEAPAPGGCQASAGTPTCLYTPWDTLKNAVGLGGNDTIAAGPPPPRKYLTEPPADYRVPTKTTKLAKEAPKAEPDPADAGAYIRDQRHKTSVDNQ